MGRVILILLFASACRENVSSTVTLLDGGQASATDGGSMPDGGDATPGDPGDPMPGDPMPGDPMPGDPMPGDPALPVIVVTGPLCGTMDFTGQDIALSGTLAVCPYTGNASTGWTEIIAKSITLPLSATIDASGAGFGGGGGGGGTGGLDSDDQGKTCTATMGGGGQGTRGGSNGTAAANCGTSGAGGAGGGPGGGTGGVAGTDNGQPGNNGGHGGYNQPGVNTDTSTDRSLRRGGGGGGGAGGRSQNSGPSCWGDGASGSSGGGAGAPGGGYVKLVATEQIVVSGPISTRGTAGISGNGATGSECPQLNRGGAGANGGAAHASGGSLGGPDVTKPEPGCGLPCVYIGTHGGNGGTGAGGGLLLRAPAINVSGALNLSGGSGTSNGGTLKLFTDIFAGSLGGNYGRLCQGGYDGACVEQ